MTAANPFARRVAGVFVSRAARMVLGFATSFLLAGALLPEGRGQYALLTLVPAMVMAIGQFGLPSAISFFAGRGRSLRELQRLSWAITISLSALLIGAFLLALPFLMGNVLKAAPPGLVVVAILSLPFQFAASFAGSALIGRMRLRNYNVILVAQSLLMLTGVLLLVVWLDLGVVGALSSYIGVGVAAALATGIELYRTVRSEPDPGPRVRLGQLTGYGLRIYPASVAGYFSYRVDIVVLSAIVGDPAAVGLYTFSVSLAELAFMVPDAVSTVFYPRVAGMDRREADALAPQVSRFTLLVTALLALALVPATWLVTHVVLPAYADSFVPFLILTPAVMAISVSKVIAGYIGGLGLPLSVAVASTINLVVNIGVNILLIPRLGIAGAAAASLISYATHAGVLVTIASRLGRHRPIEYLLPTGAEVRRLVDGIRSISVRRPA